MKYICVIATLDDVGIYKPNSDTYRVTGDIHAFKLELSAYLHNNPTCAYAMYPDKYGLMFAKIPNTLGDKFDFNIIFDFVCFDELLKQVEKNDRSFS